MLAALWKYLQRGRVKSVLVQLATKRAERVCSGGFFHYFQAHLNGIDMLLQSFDELILPTYSRLTGVRRRGSPQFSYKATGGVAPTKR